MNIIRWGAGLAVALVAATSAGAAPSALALPVVGVAGGNAVGLSEHGSQIVAFDTADPEHTVRSLGAVQGLGGDHLIGIDFRPFDHLLYGVGRTGKIFAIDPGTATAKQIGSLTVAIDGGYWDIDFNSTGSTLRVITDKGQDLRQAFGTSGPTGKTVVDHVLSRRNVAALGYTDANKALGIDTGKRQVVTINPNSGAVAGLGPANALPALKTASNGLDIVGTSAFAVVNVNSLHTLYAVDTTKGTATKVGVFNPEGETAVAFKHVIDLAIRR